MLGLGPQEEAGGLDAPHPDIHATLMPVFSVAAPVFGSSRCPA